MKKINLLAIVFIIAMMLVGTSYAVFTDSVYISNKVSTGNMNVQIHKDSKLVNSQGAEAELSFNNINHKTEATIHMKNLVPGGYAEFNINFDNTGDIDVIVDDIEIIALDNNQLLEKYIKVKTSYIISDNPNSIFTLNLRVELISETPNELQNQSAIFKVNTIFKQNI